MIYEWQLCCLHHNVTVSSTVGRKSGTVQTPTQATVKELEALRAKYGSLLTTAKSHEEMAGRAAREGQLRAEEVRKQKLKHGS